MKIFGVVLGGLFFLSGCASAPMVEEEVCVHNCGTASSGGGTNAPALREFHDQGVEAATATGRLHEQEAATKRARLHAYCLARPSMDYKVCVKKFSGSGGTSCPKIFGSVGCY